MVASKKTWPRQLPNGQKGAELMPVPFFAVEFIV
jgi:hypothetical protein